MKIKKLLFVCSGNSCRSIMAEYLMKEACKKKKIGMKLFSRGLYPEEEVSPYTIMALDDNELKSYVPKKLTQEDISGSDLVLAMNQGIKKGIILNYPSIRENLQKVYTLKEVLGYENKDINDPLFSQFILYEEALHFNPDPYFVMGAYVRCKNEISSCIDDFIQKYPDIVLPKNDLCKIIRESCKKLK